MVDTKNIYHNFEEKRVILNRVYDEFDRESKC